MNTRTGRSTGDNRENRASALALLVARGLYNTFHETICVETYGKPEFVERESWEEFSAKPENEQKVKAWLAVANKTADIIANIRRSFPDA